jgi:hypothetical protein
MFMYHVGPVFTLFCQRCDHSFKTTSMHTALCIHCLPPVELRRTA